MTANANTIVSKVLLLIAVLLFVLFAFDVTFDDVHIGWLGLGFFAASFLVP